MKPTTEILERINRDSQTNPEEVFTRLYRYMLRPDIYFLAYKHLYANNGAATRGVDGDTADGFSEEKINRIIQSLRDESYQPKPVRRSYIQKKNGSKKKRPLGLPTFTDKLVQEVLRMILEAVYEPVFSPRSHGFRPGRSCHTALKAVKHEFTGMRWFIEGDIKGCFDAIDHNVLVSIVGKKIKDARFIQLIWKFLRAGYMEDWKYHTTYSGTPQGGIVSPILANIYLTELDKYVDEVQKAFDRPRDKNHTYEYGKMDRLVRGLSQKIKNATGAEREQLIVQWKEAQKAKRALPCMQQTDKRLRYVRYADDFLIGVCGSKQDCEEIKTELKAFIANNLHMEMSEEKTYITHSNEYARFLGYDIRVRRDNKIKRVQGSTPRRTLNNKVEMNVPLEDKIEAFLYSNRIVELRNGKMRPTWRRSMIRLTPLEIVETYNSELRGLCNYYKMASNYPSLHYFAYLMEYSCLNTLAAKSKSSIGKIEARYKDGHGKWCIPYSTKAGDKRMHFADYRKCRVNKACNDIVANHGVMHSHSRNSLEARLKAKVCELCGKEDAENYELHHVRKVKDLKGKEKWEQCMIAKRRKTLAVCKDCHNAIHHGESRNG